MNAASAVSSLRVIIGPTAAGKSALALRLAMHGRGTIISADSRLVYRGFDIGTAKPTAEEQVLVPHVGIDVADAADRWSAARFATHAAGWLDAVAATGRTQWGLVVRLIAAQWDAARARGDAAPAPAVLHAVYRRGLRIAYRDPIELADLAVDGDDLRSAGVPGGPRLGTVLHALLAAVVEDPSLNTRDALLARAREL